MKSSKEEITDKTLQQKIQDGAVDKAKDFGKDQVFDLVGKGAAHVAEKIDLLKASSNFIKDVTSEFLSSFNDAYEFNKQLIEHEKVSISKCILVKANAYEFVNSLNKEYYVKNTALVIETVLHDISDTAKENTIGQVKDEAKEAFGEIRENVSELLKEHQILDSNISQLGLREIVAKSAAKLTGKFIGGLAGTPIKWASKIAKYVLINYAMHSSANRLKEKLQQIDGAALSSSSIAHLCDAFVEEGKERIGVTLNMLLRPFKIRKSIDEHKQFSLQEIGELFVSYSTESISDIRSSRTEKKSDSKELRALIKEHQDEMTQNWNSELVSQGATQQEINDSHSTWKFAKYNLELSKAVAISLWQRKNFGEKIYEILYENDVSFFKDDHSRSQICSLLRQPDGDKLLLKSQAVLDAEDQMLTLKKSLAQSENSFAREIKENPDQLDRLAHVEKINVLIDEVRRASHNKTNLLDCIQKMAKDEWSPINIIGNHTVDMHGNKQKGGKVEFYNSSGIAEEVIKELIYQQAIVYQNSPACRTAKIIASTKQDIAAQETKLQKLMTSDGETCELIDPQMHAAIKRLRISAERDIELHSEYSQIPASDIRDRFFTNLNESHFLDSITSMGANKEPLLLAIKFGLDTEKLASDPAKYKKAQLLEALLNLVPEHGDWRNQTSGQLLTNALGLLSPSLEDAKVKAKLSDTSNAVPIEISKQEATELARQVMNVSDYQNRYTSQSEKQIKLLGNYVRDLAQEVIPQKKTIILKYFEDGIRNEDRTTNTQVSFNATLASKIERTRLVLNGPIIPVGKSSFTH